MPANDLEVLLRSRVPIIVVQSRDEARVLKALAGACALLSAPMGMTVNATTGRIDWLPDATQVGPQTVVLQASDTLGGSAVQTFIVTVQPQLPDV